MSSHLHASQEEEEEVSEKEMKQVKKALAKSKRTLDSRLKSHNYDMDQWAALQKILTSTPEGEHTLRLLLLRAEEKQGEQHES